jgi:hypothetical protein
VDRDEAELALITLMADYAHRDTALEIRQEGNTYSLQLRESLTDLVQNLLPVDLSTASLRTLATIALKNASSSRSWWNCAAPGPTTTSKNCWPRTSSSAAARVKGGPTG